MARTSSLNKYLSNTPYAVLSMEALEGEQMEALFLSLENEANRVQALRNTLANIKNVKGINRDIALSLEELDAGILPFKPAGFTTAPSKTGLVLTQESLGRAIVEGSKKIFAFIMDLIKRLGTVLGFNRAATQAARKAAKRLDDVKHQNFHQIFEGEKGEQLVLNLCRADSSSILKSAVDKMPRDLEDQSQCVAKILSFASKRSSAADEDVNVLSRYDLDFNHMAQVLRNERIEIVFSEPAEKLNRDYFEQIERVVKNTAERASSATLFLSGTRLKKIANALIEISDKVDHITDDMARANENINRFIKQQPADSADWFGPELVQAITRIYRSQMKVFNLMRGHLLYCTTAVGKANDRLDDARKEVA